MTTTRPVPAAAEDAAIPLRPRPARRSAARQLVKVPAITAFFWIIKLLTTGIGESASDWMAQNTLLIPAVVGVAGLGVGLWRQFRAPRYHAPTYWFTVAMVAVFGTVVADLFNPQAGGIFNVSLPLTASAYAVALAICFALWHHSEGTLSIHAITTPRRQAFYWVTVLLTFALGTAVGDAMAFPFNLGFATSILYLAIAMVVPLLLWRVGVDSVVTFWMAYVLTRPLGASIADELGKDKPLGLGFGDGRLTAVGVALVIGLVAFLWRTKIDDPNRGAPTLA
jgi:uncharacterized membrane-anchored protein